MRSDAIQRQKGTEGRLAQGDWVDAGSGGSGIERDNVKLSLGCLSADLGPELRKGTVRGWRHNLWEGSSQELSVQGEGRALGIATLKGSWPLATGW